jgi:hypothetical protein
VALRKYIWSAVSSREIDKMPRKWRSVRPRKMVNIEHFLARVEMNFILEARKTLALSYVRPRDTSWQCENMSGAPFRPEKKTKCRVNGDPWDLEKWSILNLLSMSWDELYIVGKKIIHAVLW